MRETTKNMWSGCEPISVQIVKSAKTKTKRQKRQQQKTSPFLDWVPPGPSNKYPDPDSVSPERYWPDSIKNSATLGASRESARLGIIRLTVQWYLRHAREQSMVFSWIILQLWKKCVLNINGQMLNVGIRLDTATITTEPNLFLENNKQCCPGE